MAWPVFEFLLIHQHWNSYANTQMCHHQGKWSHGQVDNDVVMSSRLSNLNKIKSQSKKPKTLLLIFHHFKELENIVFCAMNPPLLLPFQSISSPIEYISLCNPRAFPIWPTIHLLESLEVREFPIKAPNHEHVHLSRTYIFDCYYHHHHQHTICLGNSIGGLEKTTALVVG